ncbi:MAG: sigma-70 family RNA polymerase sigma factor [bacterium]
MDARLSTLFERHGPLVYRRALQLLGNPADAEEATQEVFIRAAAALDRFDPRAKISTWLYRITSNYCLNSLRDRARQRVLLAENAEQVAPGSVPYDVGQMVLMRRLLAEADPREAAAALAVFVDGMSHAEAAAVLEVSRRTVGNLCERFTTWAAQRLAEETP